MRFLVSVGLVAAAMISDRQAIGRLIRSTLD